MKPFCEIVSPIVLPAVRALLAKNIMEKHGFTQQETARKLGITQAAISQYKRDLRGYGVKVLEKNSKVVGKIDLLGTKIAKDKCTQMDLSLEFCNLCKLIRSEKIICHMHKKIYDLENCEICLS